MDAHHISTVSCCAARTLGTAVTSGQTRAGAHKHSFIKQIQTEHMRMCLDTPTRVTQPTCGPFQTSNARAEGALGASVCKQC